MRSTQVHIACNVKLVFVCVSLNEGWISEKCRASFLEQNSAFRGNNTNAGDTATSCRKCEILIGFTETFFCYLKQAWQGFGYDDFAGG